MSRSTDYFHTTNGAKEHRIIVERILGKLLPAKAMIHHRDGDGKNNANSNLIVCEDQSYHSLIELRQAAYRATGDPNKRRCCRCKQYDNIANMEHQLSYRTSRGSGQYFHGACRTTYRKALRQRQRAQGVRNAT